MELADVSTIAVLGAGNMGHGIAEVAALAGYDVQLRDINEELVQDGYDSIEWSLNKLAEKNRISDDEATAAKERVDPVVEMVDAVGEADVIIEAVPEVMDIKTDVFSEVIAHAPDHAILPPTPPVSRSPNSPRPPTAPNGSAGCTFSTHRSGWNSSR